MSSFSICVLFITCADGEEIHNGSVAEEEDRPSSQSCVLQEALDGPVMAEEDALEDICFSSMTLGDEPSSQPIVPQGPPLNPPIVPQRPSPNAAIVPQGPPLNPPSVPQGPPLNPPSGPQRPSPNAAIVPQGPLPNPPSGPQELHSSQCSAPSDLALPQQEEERPEPAGGERACSGPVEGVGLLLDPVEEHRRATLGVWRGSEDDTHNATSVCEQAG